MKIELKGIPGVIAAVVVLTGAVGWVFYQRSTLHAQGREAAREYISLEISGDVARETLRGEIAPHEVKSACEFTITDFHPRTFLPKERTRVRVNVATDRGPRTYWLELRRVLGDWRVQRRLPEPLISW